MSNFKNEVTEFYKRDHSIRFSKNPRLDLLGHALTGLTIGTLLSLVRGTDPMPTLLLCSVGTTLWALRNQLKKQRQKPGGR